MVMKTIRSEEKKTSLGGEAPPVISRKFDLGW
jgi:hypothetical protein